MSDPHALRHPLSATIRHLLDRISGLHREEPTPPVNGPRNPTPEPDPPAQSQTADSPPARSPAGRRRATDPPRPPARNSRTHLLDGKDAAWTLRALVIRGLVQLQPIGPPRLTTRARRTLGALTDEKRRHAGPDRDAAAVAGVMAS